MPTHHTPQAQWNQILKQWKQNPKTPHPINIHIQFLYATAVPTQPNNFWRLTISGEITNLPPNLRTHPNFNTAHFRYLQNEQNPNGITVWSTNPPLSTKPEPFPNGLTITDAVQLTYQSAHTPNQYIQLLGPNHLHTLTKHLRQQPPIADFLLTNLLLNRSSDHTATAVRTLIELTNQLIETNTPLTALWAQTTQQNLIWLLAHSQPAANLFAAKWGVQPHMLQQICRTVTDNPNPPTISSILALITQ